MPEILIESGPVMACGHIYGDQRYSVTTAADGITMRQRLPQTFRPRSRAAYWCRECQQFIEPDANANGSGASA